MHNHMVVDSLSTAFIALSDPTRRLILKRLARGPASVNELAEPFHISQQAISKHLAYLERAELIEKRQLGRQRVAPCALRAERGNYLGRPVQRVLGRKFRSIASAGR